MTYAPKDSWLSLIAIPIEWVRKRPENFYVKRQNFEFRIQNEILDKQEAQPFKLSQSNCDLTITRDPSITHPH